MNQSLGNSANPKLLSGGPFLYIVSVILCMFLCFFCPTDRAIPTRKFCIGSLALSELQWCVNSSGVWPGKKEIAAREGKLQALQKQDQCTLLTRLVVLLEILMQCCKQKTNLKN